MRDDQSNAAPAPSRGELRGRALRYILVAEMMKRNEPMTVAEMTVVIDRYGYDLPGRSSKVISDALRWERRRGRVVRIARGVYIFWRAPRTTARRIRHFAARCHQHATELLATAATAVAGKDESPWADLRWLWSTWTAPGSELERGLASTAKPHTRTVRAPCG